jgi:hypothetical protein
MKNLLILTVGTGTAGAHSNLAQGLVNAIALIKPRLYFLVPSTSPDSIAIAELVAAEHPANHGGKFPLKNPDDLESCRQHLRETIAAVAARLASGERLLVNPTSGTKQMTAAATLAALDAGVGDIVFITGERADGVVKTGTERITAFDASAYFRERDFALAREFFDAGDFSAAVKILNRHKTVFPKAVATAECLRAWSQFDYKKAASAAAIFDDALRRDLAARVQHADAGNVSPLILADLLAWAQFAARRNAADAALRLAYKTLEYAARLALVQLGVAPLASGFYSWEELRNLPYLSNDLAARLQSLANPDIPLGLKTITQILRENQHPFGEEYANDPRLARLAGVRNETTHDIRPVQLDEAQALLDRVKNLLAKTFPDLPVVAFPQKLPNA